MMNIAWHLASVVGDVKTCLGSESMAVVWGVCLSVLGCCSKDDGHHFKTGVMVIIGIKWESTAGGEQC